MKTNISKTKRIIWGLLILDAEGECEVSFHDDCLWAGSATTEKDRLDLQTVQKLEGLGWLWDDIHESWYLLV